MKKIIMVFILIVMITSAWAKGGGAGGTFFGYQMSSYPFLEESVVILNNSFGLTYYGGYGYGVRSDGAISGGFGMAIMDPVNESGITGGFGGVINGVQLITMPVHLNLMSYTGFGGIYTGNNSVNRDTCFFVILEEIDLELGVPLFRWFMPVVYIGYQVAGNILPGDLFSSFLSYTPVMGVRLAWGSF